jgi:hypothetical protein
MKDPDWLVQPLFPRTKRVPPKARTSDRPPPPLALLPDRPKPMARPPLPRRRPHPRSPFHP